MLGECKLNCLESANTVSFSHFQNNEAIGSVRELDMPLLCSESMVVIVL